MKTRVAVLYGGRSGEHEISIRSAKSVIAALDREKYEVSELFITKEGKWQPRAISPEPGANPGIDVVFPALHGTFGEDGTMQGLLELADLPYVGPGVLASALAMDKEVFKRVMRASGLPVVESVTVDRARLDVEINLPFPMFVKPANLGSSVGISKVKSKAELKAALREAAKYDRKIVVECGVIGREFECSVMGNGADVRASTPCEVLPSREFYDYEDKYLLDKAVIELPARLDAEKTAEMQHLAVECYKAACCEGMSRVDFLMESATGRIYVNEINTIPGFTSISMFPKMWDYSGIPYAALLDQLIALALARHEQKKATRYTRE